MGEGKAGRETLGDVLYARSKNPVPEREWVALVQAIAAGDQLALHALYGRAHRIVFTLVLRLTANRETAEELTVDVFHDVWRRAATYDAANGTVLGWIMNQARSRAIDRLRFDGRQKRRGQSEEHTPLMTFACADDRVGRPFGLRQGAVRFQFALESAEVGEHLVDRLVTFITVFAQSLLQNGFEFEWNIRQYAG